jgi:protein tyrosine phosphatase
MVIYWNIDMSGLRKFPTIYGEVYYGQIPSDKTLEKLHDVGVSCIWNLAKELDIFIPYEKTYVPQVIHGNIPDFSTPSNMMKFVRQLDQIIAMLKAGQKVFVHCMGGHGRTGMILAALDIMLNGHPPDQALRAAKAATGGPETPDQIKFIQFLAKYFKK